MVMRQSGDNRFGFSSYVVGQVLGDGCNYAAGSGIQTAIDDVFAAGGGVVLIRPSTVPYVVDLTLRAGVDLFGASVDGRLPTGLGQVEIQGNHTLTGVGGFSIFIATNINFFATVGDVLAINVPLAGNVIIAMQDCGLNGTTDPASRAVVMNAIAGSGAQFATDNCNIQSSSHCFESLGAGNHSVSLDFGSTNSSTGNTFEMGTGSCSLSGNSATIAGSNHVYRVGGSSGQGSFSYCELSAGNEAFFHTVVSGPTTLFNSRVSSGAASGFFVDGLAGSTIQYTDLILTGSALAISPTITPTTFDWKQYAQTATAPALPTTIPGLRGTSCFDDTQFTVTDGFVQFLGTPGLITWVDQPASVTVNPNQGNFAIASITLTLPVAPAQGDVCKFKTEGAFVLVIQASGAQVIKFGILSSSAGGTWTGTGDGDAMEMTYRAASNTWIVNNAVGNFTPA